VAERDHRLKGTTKLIYGVGDVGNAVVNSAIQFFLMIFYTDAALIAPALASSALLVGKIWDAVNDPLFGWLSDRTTSRFGKRRVYMIFGALPLAVAIALLWCVPRGLPDAGTFAWIALTFILFDTVWTLTNVPYYALTAELTDDYDERASLTAFRMVLGVPAYIVGAALTPATAGSASSTACWPPPCCGSPLPGCESAGRSARARPRRPPCRPSWLPSETGPSSA
jgi:GPH family glycoside/pentoside/hexuronide:cation symporter